MRFILGIVLAFAFTYLGLFVISLGAPTSDAPAQVEQVASADPSSSEPETVFETAQPEANEAEEVATTPAASTATEESTVAEQTLEENTVVEQATATEEAETPMFGQDQSAVAETEEETSDQPFIAIVEEAETETAPERILEIEVVEPPSTEEEVAALSPPSTPPTQQPPSLELPATPQTVTPPLNAPSAEAAPLPEVAGVTPSPLDTDTSTSQDVQADAEAPSNTESTDEQANIEIAEEEAPVEETPTQVETEQQAEETPPVILTQSPTLPTIGGEVGSGNLIDRRRSTPSLVGGDEQVETPDVLTPNSPFRRFATEAEGSSLPSIGVLLEPEGTAGMEISEIPLPVSVLVSDVEGDGLQLYQQARSNGLEVFVTLRPENPLAVRTPTSAETNLDTIFERLPEAIGYAQDPVIDTDRATKNATLDSLARLGRGFLEFSSGLQSGNFGQSGAVLPTGTIALGITGEVNTLSITRTLDRAALLAAQSGSIIVILPLQREVVDALEAFSQSQRGEATALLPVSRVMDP